MNFILKVRTLQIPGYVEYLNKYSLTKPIGRVMNGYYGVTYIVAPQNGSMRDSVLMLLQTGVADLSMVPTEFDNVPDFVDRTFPVTVLDGAASHSPNLTQNTQDLLAIFDVFPTDILLMLFLATFLVGNCLYLSQFIPGFKLITGVLLGLYESFRCLIDQSNLNISIEITRGRVLALFWLLAAFTAQQTFENSMNAEMVSNDYSQVIETLDDLIRLESYQPVFVKGEYVGRHYKAQADPRFGQVWARQSTLVLETNPVAILGVGKQHQVFIGMEAGAYAATKFFCSRCNRKFLIIKQGFGFVNMAHMFRSDLPKNVKKAITARFLLMTELGLPSNFLNGILKHVSFSEDATPKCIRYSKEDLYDDKENLVAIKTANMSNLTLLFLSLVILSSFVFVLEMVAKALLELRIQEMET